MVCAHAYTCKCTCERVREKTRKETEREETESCEKENCKIDERMKVGILPKFMNITTLFYRMLYFVPREGKKWERIFLLEKFESPSKRHSDAKLKVF